MAEHIDKVQIDVEINAKSDKIEQLKKKLAGLRQQINNSAFKKPIKSIIDPEIARQVDRLHGRMARFSDGVGDRIWRRQIESGRVTVDLYKKAADSLRRYQRQAAQAGGVGKLSEQVQRNMAQAMRQVRMMENVLGNAHRDFNRNVLGQRNRLLEDLVEARRVLGNLRQRREIQVQNRSGVSARQAEAEARRQRRRMQALEDYKLSLRSRSERFESLAKKAESDGDYDRARRLYRVRDQLRAREIVAENRRADLVRRVAENENREFDRQQRYRLQQRVAHERAVLQARRNLGRQFSGLEHGTRQAASALTHPFFDSPMFYMISAGTAGGIAMAEAFQKHMKVQRAEVEANIFGELKGNDAIANQRERWLDAMAIKFGQQPETAISSFTEVLKAGIPLYGKDKNGNAVELAREATKLALQLGHALGADVTEATRVLSRIAGLTGEKGEINLDNMKAVANQLAIAAIKSGADTSEAVSAMRRGAGAVAFGLDTKTAMAATSAAITAGVQAGRAGTMVERTTEMLANATNNVSRDQYGRLTPNSRGMEIIQGARMVGILPGNPKSTRGTMRDLQRIEKEFKKDPNAYYLKAMRGLANVRKEDRATAASRLFNAEWGGEAAILATAIQSGILDNVLDAIKNDPNNATIEMISDEIRGTFDGMWRSVKSAFGMMADNFGSGLGDTFRTISRTAIALGSNFRNFRLGEQLASLIQGVFNGFGIYDLQAELTRLSDGFSGRTSDLWIAKIRMFGHGFSEGLQQALGPLWGVFKRISGDFNPKRVGQLIGGFIGLLIGLKVLKPLLGLGGVLVGVGKMIFHASTMLLALGRLGTLTSRLAPHLASGGMVAGGLLASGGILRKTLGGTFRLISRGLWIFLGLELAKAIVENWDSIKPILADAATTVGATIKDALFEFLHLVIEDLKREVRIGANKIGLDPDLLKPRDRDGNVVPDQKARQDQKLIPWLPQMPSANDFGSKGMGTILPALPEWLRLPSSIWDWVPGRTPEKQSSLTGGSGSATLAGSGGSDALFAQSSLGYQADTAKGVDQLNQTLRGMAQSLMFDDLRQRSLTARSGGAGGYMGTGGSYGGRNGQLLRPGFRGGTTGVGGQGRGFGGSGGASRATAGSGMGGGPSGTGNGSLSPSGALAEAMKYEGLNEYRDTSTLAKFMKGRDPRGAANAWCAAFMNAAYESQGIKGTGSNVATSFLNWGKQIDDPSLVQAGDALVKARGRGPGQTGGHVGMATGKTRMGRNGLEVEMISGNQGDAVTRTWERAGALSIRRALTGAGEAAAASFQPPANAETLPAGMRNNNPGNLKWSGSAWQKANFPGMVGPSENRDQGTPQIQFATAQDGMNATSTLIARKFGQGMDTVNKIITSPNGWTPGNFVAAANIARSMGVDPNQKLDLNDPATKKSFMRGLMLQEHGPASKGYSDAMIERAIQGGKDSPGATPWYARAKTDNLTKVPWFADPQNLKASPSQNLWQSHTRGIEGMKGMLAPRVPANVGPQAGSNLPANIAKAVPPPPAVQAGQVRGGDRNTTINQGAQPVSINIQGGGQDPHMLATLVQRRVSEIFQRRQHDIETDMA